MKQASEIMGKPPHAERYGADISGGFNTEDIHHFASVAGQPIADGVTVEQLVSDVSDCFSKSFHLAAAGAKIQSHSGIANWATAVHKATREMLRCLDMSEALSQYESMSRRDIAFKDWYKLLRHGFSVEPPFRFRPDTDYLSPLVEVQREQRNSRRENLREIGINLSEEDELLFEAAWMGDLLLALTPACLALILELAERVDRSNRPPKFGRGVRPDMFRRSLYMKLAGLYETMFRVPLRVRRADQTREGPSSRWVESIIRTAAKRLNEFTQPFPWLSDEVRLYAEAVLDERRHAFRWSSERAF